MRSGAKSMLYSTAPNSTIAKAITHSIFLPPTLNEQCRYFSTAGKTPSKTELCRRRLGEHAFRDTLPISVQESRERVDLHFGKIGDHAETRRHIAIERRIAHR